MHISNKCIFKTVFVGFCFPVCTTFGCNCHTAFVFRCAHSAGRKVPNVIIDKKEQSDEDDDDESAPQNKNDFLGRGDEGADDDVLQSRAATQLDELNGDGEGSDDHGLACFLIYTDVCKCMRAPNG